MQIHQLNRVFSICIVINGDEFGLLTNNIYVSICNHVSYNMGPLFYLHVFDVSDLTTRLCIFQSYVYCDCCRHMFNWVHISIFCLLIWCSDNFVPQINVSFKHISLKEFWETSI